MIWIETGIALGTVAILGVLLWNRLLRERIRERSAQLRDTQARVEAQFAHSPIPIFCWQRTGDDFTLVDLNEAAGQLYGGLPHTNIGSRASTVLARWPEGLALLHQCATEKRTLTHTGKRPVAQQGLSRWKTATFVFLPPDMVLVHSEDITEQKETELALRESEERYRRLVQHSLDGIIVRDETCYLFANDAAAKIMGEKNADRLIGTRWLDRVPPENREEAQRRFLERLDPDEPTTLNERRFIKADGKLVDTEIWALPIEWQGRPALFGMLRDITDRKRTERELKETTESLLRVQDELVRSERLAVLGQLSASVSHELRNPLGVICTSLALIEARVKNANLGLERAIARMQRSVARCDRIIGEMLDYARDQVPKFEKIDLNAWLADLLDEQEFPESIEQRREFGDFAEPVDCDPELMRRVVINLCNNARDAMLERDDDGTESPPHVLTVQTAMASGGATIVIGDTGPGMPADTVGQSLEPLFSTKPFGVGLGLPIVKKIVEQHQGEIAIESEPGRGARVTVTIPGRRTGATKATAP